MIKYEALILTIAIISPLVNSQIVCSLDELIRELYDDLIDNGKLDCLRKSVSPDAITESLEQKKLREAANWDSDCSFEADGRDDADWKLKFKEHYNLKYFLVDVDGNPVETDFDDQADMCEIIRSLVANGKFPQIGQDVRSISMDLLDLVDCPGNDSQTQPCAVTSGSFSEKSKWTILLDGQSLKINGKPNYIKDKNK